MTTLAGYIAALEATAEDAGDHGEHERAAILRALAVALREGTQAWCLPTDVERMYIDPPDSVTYTRVLVISLPDTEQQRKEK